MVHLGSTHKEVSFHISKDLCPAQEEVSVKLENCKSTSKLEKKPKVVDDEWVIEEEKIYIKKEEDQELLENEVGQPEIPMKIENNGNLSETEIKAEVIDDECKIKVEAIDIQEVGMSSELCNQEESDKCHESDNDEKRKEELNDGHSVNTDTEEDYIFKCEKCEFRTRYKGNYKAHVLRHINPEENDLFKCDKCTFWTRYRGNFKKHAVRHEEAGSFSCDQCEYRTGSKKYFRRHLLRHKMIKCDKCDYRTSNKGNLKRHLLKHNNSDESYIFRCDKCNFWTRYGESMKLHVIGHENPEAVDLLRCGECEYRTRHRSNLNRHLLRHKNPKVKGKDHSMLK